MIAKKHRVSFWAKENVLKLIVVVDGVQTIELYSFLNG